MKLERKGLFCNFGGSWGGPRRSFLSFYVSPPSATSTSTATDSDWNGSVARLVHSRRERYFFGRQESQAKKGLSFVLLPFITRMCIGGLRLHVDHRQYHRRLSERRDTPHYHRSPLSTIVATSGLFNDPTLVFDITTIVFFIATVCPRIPSVTHSNIGIRSFKFSSYFHPSLVFQLPQGFGLGCSPIAPCCSVRNVYPSIWFVVLHHHVGVRFFFTDSHFDLAFHHPHRITQRIIIHTSSSSM